MVSPTLLTAPATTLSRPACNSLWAHLEAAWADASIQPQGLTTRRGFIPRTLQAGPASSSLSNSRTGLPSASTAQAECQCNKLAWLLLELIFTPSNSPFSERKLQFISTALK